MATLLHFFNQRLSLSTIKTKRLKGKIEVANLDAGYWRLYKDNQFAGYSGKQKPAICEATDEGRKQAKVLIDAATIQPVNNLGWDFSHARRLVQVLDVLQRNRQALQDWYDLSSTDLPPPNLTQAFAAQLVSVVWNGDRQQPLFSNYWNGANGWYRVAYDNGTSACYEGYPPFGLSDSYPTGGYAIWGTEYPVLNALAQQIYTLADSKTADDKAFIQQYYSGLAATASTNGRLVAQMMFWPTLVY
jgi:hypothetical protein